MNKKIKLIKTFIEDKDSLVKEYLKEIQEYDENGNLIFSKEYEDNGNAIIELKNSYNEKNKLVSQETINYLDDITEKVTYTYNDKSKLIEERTDNDGGWFSVKKYERLNEGKTLKVSNLDEGLEIEEIIVIDFNEKGDILFTRNFDENEKLVDIVKNTYSDDGVLLLREELDRKEKLEKAHQYYYTDDSKISAVKTLNRKGKTLDWIKLEYDDNSRPIGQKSMSGAKINISYNEDNSITESQVSASGEELGATTTIKNELGNIIEEKSSTQLTKYVYEYF